MNRMDGHHMSRTMIKYGAGVLAATATTGALVLSSAGMAQAATYNDGRSDQEKSTVDGTGDADAGATATDKGRLHVTTEADGGSTTGPLGNVTSTPTRAAANASLESKRIPVADGTYRVVVTYAGLQGDENDRGETSSADTERRSVVRYVAEAGGSNRTVNRVQEVPTKKGMQRTVLLINVPNNSSGYLKVKALLRAASTADGNGSFAHADAHASDITFKVARVSG